MRRKLTDFGWKSRQRIGRCVKLFEMNEMADVRKRSDLRAEIRSESRKLANLTMCVRAGESATVKRSA